MPMNLYDSITSGGLNGGRRFSDPSTDTFQNGLPGVPEEQNPEWDKWAAGFQYPKPKNNASIPVQDVGKSTPIEARGSWQDDSSTLRSTLTPAGTPAEALAPPETEFDMALREAMQSDNGKGAKIRTAKDPKAVQVDMEKYNAENEESPVYTGYIGDKNGAMYMVGSKKAAPKTEFQKVYESFSPEERTVYDASVAEGKLKARDLTMKRGEVEGAIKDATEAQRAMQSAALQKSIQKDDLVKRYNQMGGDPRQKREFARYVQEQDAKLSSEIEQLVMKSKTIPVNELAQKHKAISELASEVEQGVPAYALRNVMQYRNQAAKEQSVAARDQRAEERQAYTEQRDARKDDRDQTQFGLDTMEKRYKLSKDKLQTLTAQDGTALDGVDPQEVDAARKEFAAMSAEYGASMKNGVLGSPRDALDAQGKTLFDKIKASRPDMSDEQIINSVRQAWR